MSEGWHYADGGIVSIPHGQTVTREQMEDRIAFAGWMQQAHRSIFGPPLAPWEKYVRAHRNGNQQHHEALRAAERARVQESTPVAPLTVEALLGLLYDTFRLDEAEVRHMIQPWCSCKTDGENGMWRCEHYNDTF